MSSLTEDAVGVQEARWNNGHRDTWAEASIITVPWSDGRAAVNVRYDVRWRADGGIHSEQSARLTVPSPAVARKLAEMFERLADQLSQPRTMRTESGILHDEGAACAALGCTPV